METASFQIVPLKQEDAKSLNELMVSNTEKFSRYFPKTLANNLTLETSKEYIEEKSKLIQSKKEFTYAIKNKETQDIAGLIIIKKVNWDSKKGEFAYCIGSKYARQGIVSEAIKIVTDYAFDTLKLKTLQIISHKNNLNSIKVAENNHFIWKKTLLNEFTPADGISLHMELYERTR